MSMLDNLVALLDESFSERYSRFAASSATASAQSQVINASKSNTKLLFPSLNIYLVPFGK
jgi:hypothetical protein